MDLALLPLLSVSASPPISRAQVHIQDSLVWRYHSVTSRDSYFQKASWQPFWTMQCCAADRDRSCRWSARDTPCRATTDIQSCHNSHQQGRWCPQRKSYSCQQRNQSQHLISGCCPDTKDGCYYRWIAGAYVRHRQAERRRSITDQIWLNTYMLQGHVCRMSCSWNNGMKQRDENNDGRKPRHDDKYRYLFGLSQKLQSYSVIE